jgi:curved DNA-binding protein CbpA
MQTRPESRHAPPQRLVREVRKALDTPALISLLAEDKELLQAAFKVLNPDAGADAGFLDELDRVCHEENIAVPDLKRRLASAAAALGLPVESDDRSSGLYEILDVTLDASESDIRRAYRTRALELHPDTNPGADPRDFARLAEAYRVLGNPELRKRYDAREQKKTYWVEKNRAFREGAGRRESLRRRQRLRLAFQLFAALGFLLLLTLAADHFFKEQALREGPPRQEAPNALPEEPAAHTLNRIEDFIASYLEACESLSYDRFMGHFAPDATQNDRALKDLQSRYRFNFERLQALACNIEVKDYTVVNGECEVAGDYVLRWRFKDGDWQEKRGPVFMALVPAENSFRLKRLVYR